MPHPHSRQYGSQVQIKKKKSREVSVNVTQSVDEKFKRTFANKMTTSFPRGGKKSEPGNEVDKKIALRLPFCKFDMINY